MEFPTVQQDILKEIMDTELTLVMDTGNPIILLICSDLCLLKYDGVTDDESLVSAIALLPNY